MDQWKISATSGQSSSTYQTARSSIDSLINDDENNTIPIRTQSPIIDPNRYSNPIEPTRSLRSSHDPELRNKVDQKENENTTHPLQRKSIDSTSEPQERKQISLTKNSDMTDELAWTWWSTYSFIITCCVPDCILSLFIGKKTKLNYQAWREKIALCSIILFISIALGLFTFGIQFLLCPHKRVTNNYSFYNKTTKTTELTWRSDIVVYGKIYPYDIMETFLKTNYNITLTRDFEGLDMSNLFDPDPEKACTEYFDMSNQECIVSNPYTLGVDLNHTCIPIHALDNYYTDENYLEFSWQDLKLNLSSSMGQPGFLVLSDSVLTIRSPFRFSTDTLLNQTLGQDGTYLFSSHPLRENEWSCLTKRFKAGVISSDTIGCIAYEIVNNLFLAIVLLLLVFRYLMALIFHGWVSHHLTRSGSRSKGFFAWRSIAGGNRSLKNHRPSSSSSEILVESPTKDLHVPRPTVLFVTCYSENQESIKRTLDSLVETTYSKDHVVLFIVVDGIIQGSGNDEPTSEICRRLLSLIDCGEDEDEPPCEYQAIGDGQQRLNRARVYTGHYRSIPALLVTKCGNVAESGPKVGNRSKRDSQLILMSFLQKVLFYERFSQLEYEIFWKMQRVLKEGLSPDKFELVLMVDADTRVAPDSISYMVAAMNNDITLMGLCGETKVANKNESWVTAIQVFEYYISHHYSKAFESVFGGVTCLPGCFSMYRVKAPKNGSWIPILASPDIINQFNLNNVDSLHAKNLLLLGEDRFLSTLMLRTFPKRQMVFVPQAKCNTVVPSTFGVLLSQRRRWINSTIHNLMELALVSDLCGISCLSMQFVVVIDLISSIVSPAATILLFMFLLNLLFTETPAYQTLFILLATLGLPSILIVCTKKDISYIKWMLLYSLAIPIWNFVLPLYSFWNFDDFTWGETRKVEEIKGEKNSTNHNTMFKQPILHSTKLSPWHVWEKDRKSMPEKRVPKTERTIPKKKTISPTQILLPQPPTVQNFKRISPGNKPHALPRRGILKLTPSLHLPQDIVYPFINPRPPYPLDFFYSPEPVRVLLNPQTRQYLPTIHESPPIFIHPSRRKHHLQCKIYFNNHFS